MRSVPDGHKFVLYFTHNVGRPYRMFQALYYALKDRDPHSCSSNLVKIIRIILSYDNSVWRSERKSLLSDYNDTPSFIIEKSSKKV